MLLNPTAIYVAMVRWYEEDERVLKEAWNSPKVAFKDLPKILTGRSLDAIKKKAQALGLGRKALERLEIDYEFLKSLTDVKAI